MFGLVPFGARKDLARRDDGFNSLFDIFNEPFFQGAMMPFGDSLNASFKVDVKDNGNAYELKADLPGLKKEDIALRYENNYLTIEAKREEAKDEKDAQGNFIRRERSYGNVSRSFYIDDVDSQRVEAGFKDGVLTVTLPKLMNAAKPKEITIKAE